MIARQGLVAEAELALYVAEYCCMLLFVLQGFTLVATGGEENKHTVARLNTPKYMMGFYLPIFF